MTYKTFLFLLAFLFLPQTGQAFETLSQNATRLTDDIVMYEVVYELGFDKYEVRAPIGAVRNQVATERTPYLGYTILDQGETPVDIGTTAGIVLSDASVLDGRYVVPKGEAAIFRLVTFLSLPATIDENLDLALQVTSLPFTMINAPVTIDGRLNASELQYYLTPEVDVDLR